MVRPWRAALWQAVPGCRLTLCRIPWVITASRGTAFPFSLVTAADRELAGTPRSFPPEGQVGGEAAWSLLPLSQWG